MILVLLGIALEIIWIVSLARYDSKDGGCIPSKDKCMAINTKNERRKFQYENQ